MPGKRTSTKYVPVADSPFSDFLDTDRVPSLQESKTIQELLAEKVAHLAYLNSKVPKPRSAKKIPRKLRAELEHTRRYIKFHRAVVSPWRRLPVEIISEIFLFTLDPTEREEDEDEYWHDDKEGTLRLSQVCRTWRAIALSTPALWNILTLTLNAKSRPLDWAPWLERSRSFPLYLQVFWNDEALPSVINRILSLFCSHLHHTAGLWIDGLAIDDLELMAEDSYPLGTFPLLPPPYAPLLNTVSADLPPNSNWDWIRAACKASPCLSRLTTSQFSIDWFSVTNLTQVHFIDPVSMFEVLQVMEQATGLEDGSFDVIGPNATCSTGKTLVMSKMWRLEVTSPDHLGEFLDQLELPCLADISMHQIANWPEEQFNSFLSRSSCALQKLEFHEVDIFEDQLIECLRKKACNTLEHLIGVNIIPPASRLIQHLTYRSSPYPNPRLETIVLGNVEAEDGLFAAFLESRVVKTTRDANGPPCAVRTAGFSFIEGAHHSRETTHLEDWRRLRILERMCPDLTLIWPNPDDEED